MKKWLVLMISLFCFSAHASGGYFLPSGTQYLADGKSGSGGLDETGQVSGVPYHIYFTDGSAKFGKTDVKCSQDEFSGERSCYVALSDLFISYDAKAGYAVLIGDEQALGTKVAVRLDDGQPVATIAPGWKGKAAASLVRKIENAKVVKTRYIKWPYIDAYVQGESEIDQSVRESLRYMKFAVARK